MVNPVFAAYFCDKYQRYDEKHRNIIGRSRFVYVLPAFLQLFLERVL